MREGCLDAVVRTRYLEAMTWKQYVCIVCDCVPQQLEEPSVALVPAWAGPLQLRDPWSAVNVLVNNHIAQQRTEERKEDSAAVTVMQHAFRVWECIRIARIAHNHVSRRPRCNAWRLQPELRLTSKHWPPTPSCCDWPACSTATCRRWTPSTSTWSRHAVE